MFKIKIDVDETPDSLKVIDRAIDALSASNLERILDTKVAPFLQMRIESRFRNEGDNVVGKWRPLAASTNMFRIRQGFPAAHPINVRTGEMRRAATKTKATTALGSKATLQIPGNGLGALTEKKITRAQRGGGNPGQLPFPPRPILALGAVDNRAVVNAFRLGIARSMGNTSVMP